MTFTEHPYNNLRKRFGALLSDQGFDLMNKYGLDFVLVLTAIGLFRKLGALNHVQLRCCFRVCVFFLFLYIYINDINQKLESDCFSKQNMHKEL